MKIPKRIARSSISEKEVEITQSIELVQGHKFTFISHFEKKETEKAIRRIRDFAAKYPALLDEAAHELKNLFGFTITFKKNDKQLGSATLTHNDTEITLSNHNFSENTWLHELRHQIQKNRFLKVFSGSVFSRVSVPLSFLQEFDARVAANYHGSEKAISIDKIYDDNLSTFLAVPSYLLGKANYYDKVTESIEVTIDCLLACLGKEFSVDELRENRLPNFSSKVYRTEIISALFHTNKDKSVHACTSLTCAMYLSRIEGADTNTAQMLGKIFDCFTVGDEIYTKVPKDVMNNLRKKFTDPFLDSPEARTMWLEGYQKRQAQIARLKEVVTPELQLRARQIMQPS